MVEPLCFRFALPRCITPRTVVSMVTVLGSALLVVPSFSQERDFPRLPNGRPDLSGTYDVATLTPTERPPSLGDQLELSDEQAEAMARQAEARYDFLNQASDPDRDAPAEGGNVGGYNYFWLDPGNGAIRLDGKWRTSIITDPANGRMPPMTETGETLRQDRLDRWGRSSGLQESADAWWLDLEEGPYDGPEMRPMGERCVLGFGSPAGPPILPVVYNNLKRVVHTEDYLMILAEMVHDARIIPILAEGEERPQLPDHPSWLGHSVGRWEGDDLVVETSGFFAGRSPLSAPGLRQNLVTSGELRVTERFSRIDADRLRYEFTVEDPVIWTASWSGEYPWPEVDVRVYEYACHEGNYALGNILRGARLAEREAEVADSGDSN